MGINGYLRRDGSRQNRALAFLGRVAAEDHVAIDELFILDLPDDLTIPGEGPLAGTKTLSAPGHFHPKASRAAG